MDVPRTRHAGWIEVIVGSMFSGKSEELIRRLRRAQIARQKVQIFKPAIDNRYADDHIVSHSEMRIASRSVHSSRALLQQVDDDTEVVGIDEGQFFDLDLPAVCNELADRGKRVIVAGLDQDYLGKPFEPIPQLLAIAEYITKTLAICVVCGRGRRDLGGPWGSSACCSSSGSGSSWPTCAPSWTTSSTGSGAARRSCSGLRPIPRSSRCSWSSAARWAC
ncbi:MAG: tdk [Acidobacteria bacterium]|nr:tdk [Acidobacteriota bacterium]